jgi:pilus assembly protein CpaE
VRDTLRLLALPAGPEQPRRPLLVLNRVGRRGTLARRKIEEALKMKVDIAIPDLPRAVETAATMGEAIAAQRNGFRRAITELAALSAFIRLLDAPKADSAVAGRTATRRGFSLFSRK